MKFSLIVATLGRTDVLYRLFDSFAAQKYKDFEVIIVDQNSDDRVVSVLQLYNDKLDIKHIQTPKPGLSRARNIGIKSATGDVFAFPDDDCWYPPEILLKVKAELEKRENIDMLSMQVLDEKGDSSVGRCLEHSAYIDKANVWRTVTSISLFIRSCVIKKIGGFDEQLGLGAGTKWESAEDVDFPLRALNAGFTAYYNSDLFVNHPKTTHVFDRAMVKRGRKYSLAHGYVMRKHKMPLTVIFVHFIRPMCGAFLSLLRGRIVKARYHFNVLIGRIEGYFSSE